MAYCAGKEKIKKCACGNILWEWIEDDKIKILGTNGQDYEVGFNYIYLKCKKCGKITYEHSSIADDLGDMAERANKFPTISSTAVVYDHYRLNTFDREILLSKLSEKQKEIYDLLAGQDFFHRISTEEIAKMVKLPEDRVCQHIKSIELEIKKINPNFGKFKYTKTFVRSAANKDELESLGKKFEGLDKESKKE
ncbi:MAG: hypothetical protein WC514_01155 [Candidatus Paceibacterota bacterium]